MHRWCFLQQAFTRLGAEPDKVADTAVFCQVVEHRVAQRRRQRRDLHIVAGTVGRLGHVLIDPIEIKMKEPLVALNQRRDIDLIDDLGQTRVDDRQQ